MQIKLFQRNGLPRMIDYSSSALDGRIVCRRGADPHAAPGLVLVDIQPANGTPSITAFVQEADAARL